MKDNDLFKKTIQNMNIQQYWQRLVESGWLSEIPLSEHGVLKSRIEQAFSRTDSVAIFYVFYALAVVNFDPESIEDTGPSPFSYYHIINLLAKNSFGLFCPENVMDELDKQNQIARVSFQFNQQSFYCEVPWLNEWFDLEVLNLVNEALKSSDTDARFIELPTCDQLIYLVLISEKAYQRAIELDLIPAGATFDHKS